ncbi:MAG: methyltransferase domain-containing protein [Candidatus Eremiobacteraeota bacterium]|nr:methyltransferase domain-containing protein [Candidatus Eremiobacteraeota bacterium]
MGTAERHGSLWGRGTAAWAEFQEPNFLPIYEAVFSRLDIRDGTRLLDVGCGAGLATSLASRRGAVVSGIDASAPSIEFARSRTPDGTFVVGDLEALPFADGSFDVVVGFNSLQFAERPLEAFREVRRVLAPSGRLGIAWWAPREKSEHSAVMSAVAGLLSEFPQPDQDGRDPPGPFALSGEAVVERLLAEAEFAIAESGEVAVAFRYADLPTALRALSSSGTTQRAAEAAGEERVRAVITTSLAPFQTASGGYVTNNRFRWFIASPR